MTDRSRFSFAALLGWVAAGVFSAGAADASELAVSPDSSRFVREARSAQAAFERLRVRELPWGYASLGGECDETIGRMCIRHGRDWSWEPAHESDGIRTGREELLVRLEEIAREIPGDPWVLGQRVRYLGESDRWREAERLARVCGVAEAWWCDALLGYALHHQGRFDDGARAFDRALEAMPPEQAERWRDPAPLLDAGGRRLLDQRRDDGRRTLEELVWVLANPMFLVPGNDRRTEHFARHVASALQDGARNPYGLRWGRDLEEITIRYGVEYGWEKVRPSIGHTTGFPDVVGRFHPRGRGFMPPGRFLEDPAGLPAGEWTTDERRVRSRHAPPYAPRILALESQLAVFRRGDSLEVVSAWELPEWREAEQAPAEPPPPGPYQAGLFLVAVGDYTAGRAEEAAGSNGTVSPSAPLPAGRSRVFGEPTVHGRTAEVERRSVLRLRAPPGEYVLSLEVLHPGEKKGWRAREGVRLESLLVDGGEVVVSSLLLVEAGADESWTELERVVDRALPGSTLVEGSPVGVVWETYGLGPGAGTVSFRLVVERTDRNLLRRAGEWLRVVDPRDPVAVAWSEPAPETPGIHFRAVDLALDRMAPGEYTLRLDVRVPGRPPASSRREVRIVPGV